jgi:SpoVK/Ycf46/Vps4 family AAA+-type ATPase
MKTIKTRYFNNKLSKEEINGYLVLLDLSKKKNKAEAELYLQDLLEDMSDESANYFVDYLVANQILHHEVDLKDVIKFFDRSELVESTKTLLLCRYVIAEDLGYDEDFSIDQISNNLESLLEEHSDKLLQDLLLEHEDSFMDQCKIPNHTYKRYFLKILGIEPEKDSGDEIFLSSNYNLDLLNIADVNSHDFIEKLKKVQEYLKKEGSKEFYNYSIIFEGASGVGKTEFAKYLASVLGQHFTYVSFGGLSSGYHGETESNIKTFFDEARKNNSLIFIDEADSFLFNRQSGKLSFEISIVNEMLQQIEKYPGIVICSTNLLGKVDHAALRRFAEKITFNYLKIEQARKAFEIYFKNKLNNNDAKGVDQIKNLSLGDFKVVRQKTFFDEKITNKDLINLLGKEVNYRQRIENTERGEDD